MSGAAARELAAVLGADVVLPGDAPGYDSDATESRGMRGRADAIVLPRTAEEVAAAVRWCYDNDVAVVPRGGGTGFAGGAVPVDGGVVVSLERLCAVLSFEPERWRMHCQAGLRTRDVQRLARENGLLFPPDPGAAEQSQIGGNIATNAGGPHAFKYGTTGAWVTGIEAVIAPGVPIAVGGPIRKDVAGYDLLRLLVGSEGTLGIITSAWLRFVPAPAAALPVAAFYPGPAEGCAAIDRVLESGLLPAALEYLDAGTLAAAGAAFPWPVPAGAGFLVIAEADGGVAQAAALRAELSEALELEALDVVAPTAPSEISALWRWREGVSIAVTAARGGKVSEDVVVPAEHLRAAVEATVEIGGRHGLDACSWGHAGDGNLHSTFLVDPSNSGELDRADAAAQELFAVAAGLGGSISGEHGVGIVKRGQLSRQWNEAAVGAHEAIKRALDPKGLLNPGKKLGR